MNAPTLASAERASRWLAAALVAMPLLQALPLDFDRTGALVLLLPALWAGRGHLAQALQEVLRHRGAAVAMAIVASATIVATARADQPAPALVTAAEWVLLAGSALMFRRIARETGDGGRVVLAGLSLGAALAISLTWAWWLATGRADVPLYAHYRHVGLHTLPGAIASLGCVLAAASRSKRLGWLALGVIVWGGLLWSGGRAPLLALAVALGACWFAFANRRAELVRWVAALMIGGLLLSLVFWTPRPEMGWWHAVGRTASAATKASASELTSTRTEFWRETIVRAREAPWFGHGPDSYRFTTPKLDGQQPHNFILQLWLDLGLVGAIPALALLSAIMASALRRLPFTPSQPQRIWVAIATASMVCGLLDGVFYHLLALLPAVLALGVASNGALERTEVAPSALAKTFTACMASVAIGLLALHSAVFYELALGEPPEPTASRALLVRNFPSTTFGLWRWLDAWQHEGRPETLEWARWAETHSASQPLFHVYTARILASRHDLAGARAELLRARATAHWTERPVIDAMLDNLQGTPR